MYFKLPSAQCRPFCQASICYGTECLCDFGILHVVESLPWLRPLEEVAVIIKYDFPKHCSELYLGHSLWNCSATEHQLKVNIDSGDDFVWSGQCCPRSMSPNGVTRPQWVNTPMPWMKLKITFVSRLKVMHLFDKSLNGNCGDNGQVTLSFPRNHYPQSHKIWIRISLRAFLGLRFHQFYWFQVTRYPYSSGSLRRGWGNYCPSASEVSRGLTLIPAWICNNIHHKIWNENYLSIPKLQRCNRWSLGMDK